MTTSWLRIDPAPGVRLAADALQGNAPAYVWLHAFGASRVGEHSAALFTHAAARGRAAVRFDFRGHGDSSGTIGAMTTGDLVADVHAVLATTGPAILIGHSLGALVAAIVATQRPDTVRGLCLMAPSLPYREVLRRAIGADGRLRTIDGREFAVQHQLLDDADALDERALPGKLTMPVLVVHGDRDDTAPVAAALGFAAAVPHTHKETWLVPGADHRLAGATAGMLARADRLFANGAKP